MILGYHYKRVVDDLLVKLDRLVERMDEADNVTTRFEAHEAECNRRYADLEIVSKLRHDENTRRLDRQDGLLTWILCSSLVGALALVGVLINIIVHAAKLL